MTIRSAAATLALLLTPCFVSADTCGRCCPKTVFPRVKSPRIKYQSVCPKPICPCTGLENYGYYPTIWHPWPFPPSITAPCLGVSESADQLPPPLPSRFDAK